MVVVGRLLIGMFVLATVVAGGWLLREPVLREATDLWIVSDPISRADAIVVLGGGLDNPAFRGGGDVAKRSCR